MAVNFKPRTILNLLFTLGMWVALLVSCGPPPPPTATPTPDDVSTSVTPTLTSFAKNIPSGMVDVDGQPRFLFGANYPWYQYGIDFGENAWGHNGVSAKRDDIERDFDTLSGMGVRVVRWFVFADGRAAPEFAGDGSVAGLDDKVFADLDAALEIAQQRNVRLILVLLDFHWLAQQRNEDGVFLGGHADVVQDAAKRETFFQQALLPLLERYGQNPYILAWEVINEPEWAIDDPDIQTDQPLVRIPAEEMQSFVGEAAQFIDQNASQMIVALVQSLTPTEAADQIIKPVPSLLLLAR